MVLLSITLGACGGKSATLSWDIPTTREDGSTLPINEIAGFKIYSQRNNGSYWTEYIPVIDTYTFNNLEQGLWRFWLVTVDTDGLASEYSKPVSKVVL